jgi:hypothetical protein
MNTIDTAKEMAMFAPQTDNKYLYYATDETFNYLLLILNRNIFSEFVDFTRSYNNDLNYLKHAGWTPHEIINTNSEAVPYISIENLKNLLASQPHKITPHRTVKLRFKYTPVISTWNTEEIDMVMEPYRIAAHNKLLERTMSSIVGAWGYSNSFNIWTFPPIFHEKIYYSRFIIIVNNKNSDSDYEYIVNWYTKHVIKYGWKPVDSRILKDNGEIIMFEHVIS